MKITKTKLMQIIKEELAEARGVEFSRLGTGYSDEDVEYGPPVEDDPYYGVEDDPNEREPEAESAETTRGSEEELLTALQATGERSWDPRDIADIAKVAAEAARKAALDADPYSQTADAVVYNAIIEYFRSKSQR